MAGEEPPLPFLHVDGVRLPTPGAWLQILAVEGAPGSSRFLYYLGYYTGGMWYIYMVEVMSAYVSDEGTEANSFA